MDIDMEKPENAFGHSAGTLDTTELKVQSDHAHAHKIT